MTAEVVLICRKNGEEQSHLAYLVDKLKIISILVDFVVDKYKIFTYNISVFEGRGNVCPDLIEND